MVNDKQMRSKALQTFQALNFVITSALQVLESVQLFMKRDQILTSKKHRYCPDTVNDHDTFGPVSAAFCKIII